MEKNQSLFSEREWAFLFERIKRFRCRENMSICKSDYGSIDTFFLFYKTIIPFPFKFQSTTRRVFPCPLESVIADGFWGGYIYFQDEAFEDEHLSLDFGIIKTP